MDWWVYTVVNVKLGWNGWENGQIVGESTFLLQSSIRCNSAFHISSKTIRVFKMFTCTERKKSIKNNVFCLK